MCEACAGVNLGKISEVVQAILYVSGKVERFCVPRAVAMAESFTCTTSVDHAMCAAHSH